MDNEPSRWITQSKLHSDDVVGNCTESCIASILDLPIEEVPDFHKDLTRPGEETSSDEIREFWRRIEDFLQSKNRIMMTIPLNWVPPVYYLASGNTVRDTHHMVIMRDSRIFHDPHPSRAGLSNITHKWLIIPEDPRLG